MLLRLLTVIHRLFPHWPILRLCLCHRCLRLPVRDLSQLEPHSDLHRLDLLEQAHRRSYLDQL